MDRRERTRQLIELGGLIAKAGLVELTGDDRAVTYGALLAVADVLQGDEREKAVTLWAAKGKQAFTVKQTADAPTAPQEAFWIGDNGR